MGELQHISQYCDSGSDLYLFLRRYVGNTMAAFVMQVLGYEVAALNTVQFSKSSSSPDYSQDNRTCNEHSADSPCG